jgi:RhtB (resistance to homoserine/threonine) family protein
MIEYFTIAVIALLASISPGPDFVVVARSALTRNRNMAVMTSLGVGSGMLVHTVYCVLGLALVISNSMLLFNSIKYAGACYLIYLGIKSLISKNNQLPTISQEDTAVYGNTWKAFRDGLITNVFNPKVTLFMLSIFTVMIDPHTSRLVQASYGLEIAFITGSWFVFLSFGLTHPYVLKKISNLQKIISISIGLALMALGILVIIR